MISFYATATEVALAKLCAAAAMSLLMLVALAVLLRLLRALGMTWREIAAAAWSGE